MNKKFFYDLVNKFGKEKITIVVLIGILLMVISIPTGSKSDSKTKQKAAADEVNVQSEYTFSEYEEYLENKLKNALSKVSGAGEVCVVVSLENTAVKNLAADEESKIEQNEEVDSDGNNSVSINNSSKKTNIYYDGENGEQPFVTSEAMPEVKGVIIVAKGGGDGKVASEITLAVEALLGVPTHKIKVLKMS